MSSEQQVINTIQERRSINFFDPERAISDDTIMELIKIANLSPSSLNLQPWEVVVVKKSEKKSVLRGCAFDQPKVEEASAVLIMIANPNAVEENIDKVVDSWLKLGYIQSDGVERTKGTAHNLYGDKDSLQRKLFAVKNTALFAMTLMIAAKGMGLETHPMDGIDEGKIKKEFNIPDDRIIPMIVTLGYLKSGIDLLPRAFRREVSDFVKSENY
ncbi:MAG: nitroreductase family protein [Spirochaetota bacterium]|nr:nitroreductase family protein [Spirochaetota bacterium]